MGTWYEQVCRAADCRTGVFLSYPDYEERDACPECGGALGEPEITEPPGDGEPDFWRDAV